MEPHDGCDRGDSRDEAGGSVTVWCRFRSWLSATLQRSRMESEMDVEMRFHMEAYAEDLVRGGLPRDEAARRARIEFGGIEQTSERADGGSEASREQIQNVRPAT